MTWLDELTTDVGWELAASLITVVIAVATLFILRFLVRRWAKRVETRYGASDHLAERERAQRLSTLTEVSMVVVSIVVLVVAGLTVMAIWGVPMSPLLAVGATVGIAIGFGAQDLVRDVIAGFLILVEDQYAIGDVVSIADVSGTVDEIRLRTTVLRDLEGSQHHVPNGQIRVASNLTAGFSRVVVDVPVAYDTDIDFAIAVISHEAESLAADPEWSGMFLEEPKNLGVNKLGDSAVDIRITLTTDTERRWVVKREFLKRIKIRLDQEGIEIPFRYLNVITRDLDS